MPDPITIGALTATALASGAAEAGKAVLGKAAGDAYAALKALVSAWASPDVTALEARVREGTPTKAREAVIAEAIDARPAADRHAARALAEALGAALADEGRASALGTTLNQFNAYDNARQYNAPGGMQIFNAPSDRPRDEA